MGIDHVKRIEWVTNANVLTVYWLTVLHTSTWPTQPRFRYLTRVRVLLFVIWKKASDGGFGFWKGRPNLASRLMPPAPGAHDSRGLALVWGHQGKPGILIGVHPLLFRAHAPLPRSLNRSAVEVFSDEDNLGDARHALLPRHLGLGEVYLLVHALEDKLGVALVCKAKDALAPVQIDRFVLEEVGVKH